MMACVNEAKSTEERVEAVLFVHRDFRHRAEQVSKILNERFGMNCCLVSSSQNIGESSMESENKIEDTCKLRVFIMTTKFIREDFKCHGRLLNDPEKSTKENTLFILTGKRAERILEKYSQFTRICLESVMSSEEMAHKIADFAGKGELKNSKKVMREVPGREDNSVGVTYNINANVVVMGEATIKQEKVTVGSGVNVHSTKESSRNTKGCTDEVASRNEGGGLEVKGRDDTKDIAQYEEKHSAFLEIFGEKENQSKRGYILIASSIHAKLPGLENIASIPWLRVFDFDPKSRVNGLLSVAEPVLKSKRYYTTTDLLEDMENLNDNITNWVFINGYSDSADTLHTGSRKIPSNTIRQHTHMLMEHCQGKKVMSILALWYEDDEESYHQLFRFLHGIKMFLEGSLGKMKCILCMEKEPDPGSQLYTLLDFLTLSEHIWIVPFTVLCFWLNSFHLMENQEYLEETLPKFADEGGELIKVPVPENDSKWINVCFDLLTMRIDNSRPKLQPDGEELEEGVNFLKGADISWAAIKDGRYDATRDLLCGAKEFIRTKHVLTGKSGVITIYHSPSGGGTAFARRLLWELREEVPCVELKASQINWEDIKERLKRIRSITKLPVVMLVDGKSDHEIKKIMEFSRILTLVVIHLQRYYSAIKKAYHREETFYLPDLISVTEAEGFYSVFSRIATRKKRYLSDIRAEITERKTCHFVFEFGLAAFEKEFRGLVRYVHGYLQINENGDSNLNNWQTALGFLSLANYYGSNNRGLPCQLLGKLLQKDANEIIYLDDLPYSATQFITEDKFGNWKITHYIVSLVILEQVLVRRQSTEYEWGSNNSLTTEARPYLKNFAIQFIEYLSSLFDNLRIVPGHVSDILTSIFIKRHNNDPGEKDFSTKPILYSRLLYDTGSAEDKLAVLQTLAKHFPYNAEFQAHVGRFYYQHKFFKEAIECLSEAESIRKEELESRGVRSDNNKGDDVLERIFNMFGFCYNAHVKHLLGCSLGNLRLELIREKKKPTLITECLTSANNAIKKFGEGRRYFQQGSNPTFSYLGEIKVRLQVTELASVLGGRDLSGLESRASPYDELKAFALASFHECDHLLAQCIYLSTEKAIREVEMNYCINNFQMLFKGAKVALERWAGDDSTVRSKRCRLSLLKLHLKKPNNKHRFRVYDDIRTKDELDQIIRLYEDIFDGVHKKKDLNIRISNYMMEWLQAIRHSAMQRRYSQTEVLARIEKWSDRREQGSMAAFYSYVVSTLISLSSPPGEISNSYSEKSNKYKESMNFHVIPVHLLDRSIEWLSSAGEDGSFDQLKNSSSLGDWNGKFWNSEGVLSQLKVCTGRIHKCKTRNGSIIIDGGQVPPISVHFIPHRYDISVSHSKQKTRVEFYLGFNPRHKAEAFEVTVLNSYSCPRCKTPTEVKTLGKAPRDQWDHCRNCEEIVTPTSS